MKNPSDLLCDAIAERVAERLRSSLEGRIEPRLLNLQQASDYLARPPDVIRKMVAAGRIPNSSGDRRVLLDRRDLDAFVEHCKRVGNAE